MVVVHVLVTPTGPSSPSRSEASSQNSLQSQPQHLSAGLSLVFAIQEKKALVSSLTQTRKKRAKDHMKGQRSLPARNYEGTSH